MTPQLSNADLEDYAQRKEKEYEQYVQSPNRGDQHIAEDARLAAQWARDQLAKRKEK